MKDWERIKIFAIVGMIASAISFGTFYLMFKDAGEHLILDQGNLDQMILK